MNIFELLDGPIPPPELGVAAAIGQGSTRVDPWEAPSSSENGSTNDVKPEPAIEPPEVIGRRMSESEILELWQERACIIHEGNVELVQWCESQKFTPERIWRYCELLAAGDMSLTYGTYTEAVIRPRLTTAK